jgi:hypothetical protein
MSEGFPKYLAFKDRTYSIQGYIDDTAMDEFKDNKGYIDENSGRIYICALNNDPMHDDVPVLKVTTTSKTYDNGSTVDNCTIKKIDTKNPTTYEYFVEKNAYNLSIGNIVENTTGDEVLYNEEALRDMNAATSIFVPIINEEDDALKKIIKQTIISKQIDINRLKHKMPQKYGLTNMKSALVGKTKMSIQNFCIWCELLGVDFEFIICDNGTDKENPLYRSIHYVSNSNRVIETKD